MKSSGGEGGVSHTSGLVAAAQETLFAVQTGSAPPGAQQWVLHMVWAGDLTHGRGVGGSAAHGGGGHDHARGVRREEAG